MVWNNEDAQNNLISREEAQKQIMKKASDEGIKGPFKVFYDGELMVTPASLPAQVDMELVRVSSVLDNA